MEDNQNIQQEVNTENKTAVSSFVIGVGLLLVLVVGMGIFANQRKGQIEGMTDTSSDEMNQAEVIEEANSTVAEISVSDVKIVAVEAGSFYYKPNEIKVKKGEKVKIIMRSVDMMHDFNIDELGISIPITKSGETAEVEFVAEKIGKFEFYCSVGQHRANGQIGTLIVE